MTIELPPLPTKDWKNKAIDVPVILDYPSTTDVPSEATTYNGWTNYETWNAALWLDHDEPTYRIALNSKDYKDFVRRIVTTTTGDGISWTDNIINVQELDEKLWELQN